MFSQILGWRPEFDYAIAKLFYQLSRNNNAAQHHPCRRLRAVEAFESRIDQSLVVVQTL